MLIPQLNDASGRPFHHCCRCGEVFQRADVFFARVCSSCLAPAAQYHRESQRERRRAVLLRTAVIERDGKRCRYCGCDVRTDSRKGLDVLEVDHVVALRNGGLSTLDNLVVACRRCNLSKQTKGVA